jgi:ATP-dependent Clp protease ATP-binding subunit ClpA
VSVPRLTWTGLEQEGVERGKVDGESVAGVIAKWTGIPEQKLTESESERLLRMEEHLHERVVGQEEAVSRVAGLVRRSRVGLRDRRRPVGVFLFLGPTGVGKTELAKALAEALFGSEDQMIRLDMSEYQERHTVSRLIGAPPGYVGYEEEGQLTGQLRDKPYSVVLLDEIEKANPEIFDVFLQVFGEGRLTDSKGRTVVASHAIFIMTSNLPPERRRVELGLQAQEEQEESEGRLSQVRRHFRPEFVNRIDEAVVFHPLSAEHVAQIARRRVERLRKQVLEEQEISLEVTEEAISLLARLGHDDRSGARELNRVVERLLEEPLSERILAGKVRRGEILVAGVSGEKLEFEREPGDTVDLSQGVDDGG